MKSQVKGGHLPVDLDSENDGLKLTSIMTGGTGLKEQKRNFSAKLRDVSKALGEIKNRTNFIFSVVPALASPGYIDTSAFPSTTLPDIIQNAKTGDLLLDSSEGKLGLFLRSLMSMATTEKLRSNHVAMVIKHEYLGPNTWVITAGSQVPQRTGKQHFTKPSQNICSLYLVEIGEYLAYRFQVRTQTNLSTPIDSRKSDK